ncbi:MAG TPA: hypothetical protein VL201_03875 [Patescibacteria group bacterium]|jgi:hypothetical protein|nr:hypothetical protein [Patescibacteria group bacterium]
MIYVSSIDSSTIGIRRKNDFVLFVNKYIYIVVVTIVLHTFNIYAVLLFLDRPIENKWQSIFIHMYRQQQAVKQSLDLFLQKYAPPEEITVYLNAQDKIFFKECIIPKKITVKNKLYWVKARKVGERIFNAIRLKECITREHLTRLDVAKKYIYCTDKGCLTISEHVERDYAQYDYDEENNKYMPKHCFFDEEITKQLSSLAIATGFIDWSSWQNCIIDKDKKMIFIDTEDRSFFGYKKYVQTRPHACHVQVLSRLLDCVSCDSSTNNDTWLKKQVTNELQRCEANEEYCKKNRIQLLMRNNQLDPADFDLNMIRTNLMYRKQQLSTCFPTYKSK